MPTLKSYESTDLKSRVSSADSGTRYHRRTVWKKLCQWQDRGDSPQDTHALQTIYRHLGSIRNRWHPFVERPTHLPAEIGWLLDLGTYELHYARRAAAYGTVSDCVNLAKEKYRGLASLVNAVLRKVAQLNPSTDQPHENFLPWMPFDDDIKSRLMTEPTFIGWDENGLSSTPDFKQVRHGEQSIQSLSSRYIVETLNNELSRRPRARFLDLCAGRGGKFLPILRGRNPDQVLVATDRDIKRRKTLEESLPEPKYVRAFDQVWESEEMWDVILLDAPCTGSGTWNKHPRSKWLVSPKTIDEFAKTQRNLLEWAFRRVGPGGLILYAVCSLFEEEGPAHFSLSEFGERMKPWPLAESFLRQHNADFRATSAGGIHILPGNGFEGFFIQLIHVN